MAVASDCPLPGNTTQHVHSLGDLPHTYPATDLSHHPDIATLHDVQCAPIEEEVLMIQDELLEERGAKWKCSVSTARASCLR